MNILESCAHKVFERLWQNYTSLVPDARTIEQALRTKGEIWNEDHVAFRTFPGEFTGRHVLIEIFKALGYTERDKYFFQDKQIDAIWLEPPGTVGGRCDQVAPKVFVSELILKTFSPEFQSIVTRAADQVKSSPLEKIKALSQRAVQGDSHAADELVNECVSYLSGGAPWARPTVEDYEVLRKESEYAAWTLLFGFNINHFTVSVQLMNNFHDIDSLNTFIQRDLNIPLNTAGGVTKGTPELRLQQSSSLAAHIPVPFQNGIRIVPYAFVEFAYRWALEGKKSDGMWHSYYQGFVMSNADKIFESTNVRRNQVA
jgi:hypothetical protein